MSIRLLVHVEGQTEESFVRDVLRQYLIARGFDSVDARIVGNARQRQMRGGIRSWQSVRKTIVNHLREDPGCVATTMVDYYGLPEEGDRAWPGRADARRLNFSERADCVERGMLKEIAAEIGRADRFVPFVVMHEFEGLLFSDCGALSRGIERPDFQPQFENIRRQFASPEEINDSADTAPSKRIARIVPNYEKPLLGVLAAIEIGLDRIRAECPHFAGWLSKLESLAGRSK